MLLPCDKVIEEHFGSGEVCGEREVVGVADLRQGGDVRFVGDQGDVSSFAALDR